MSGGFFNYEDSKLFEFADKIFEDKTIDEINFSHLLRDIGNVLHEYDYYICGDTGKEDFDRAWKLFIEKYKIKFEKIGI